MVSGVRSTSMEMKDSAECHSSPTHGEGVMGHVKEKMSDVNEGATNLCGS